MSVSEESIKDQLDSLYSSHHGWLVGWLRRKLDCSQQAADLAQDVFVRLLARRKLVTLKEPRSYLSSVARGLVIDYWRRRDVEQAWLEMQARLPESEVISPEEQYQIIETLVLIDQALDELKPRARQAFQLAQLEGLTIKQISEQLNVSHATVERDLAAALRQCYRIRFCGSEDMDGLTISGGGHDDG